MPGAKAGTTRIRTQTMMDKSNTARSQPPDHGVSEQDTKDAGKDREWMKGASRGSTRASTAGWKTRSRVSDPVAITQPPSSAHDKRVP